MKKLNTQTFIERANIVHTNKYAYNEATYVNARTKVKVFCPEHGSFKQTPATHLYGSGCPTCAKNKRPKSNVERSSNKFIEKARMLHKDKYSYNKISYVHSKTRVTITCPEHGDFEQTPNNHLTGYGCQDCAVTGFDNAKRAILYYLKITTNANQTLYKIGITNRTVNERFSLIDLSRIEVIKQKEFAKGLDAYKYKQEVLKKYSGYKYVGPKIPKSGNTELFTLDILEFENCEVFDV